MSSGCELAQATSQENKPSARSYHVFPRYGDGGAAFSTSSAGESPGAVAVSRIGPAASLA